MPRAVEEIEGTVSEVVVGWKSPNLAGFALFREINFSKLSAMVIGFSDWCIFIRRIAWGIILLEAGADD